MAYDDYEQGEQVREWLRQNGLAIVVGLVIGLALLFGYRQWTKHRANAAVEAASQYELVTQAWGTGDASKANALTDSLMEHHDKSAYAVFAATLRAQHAMDNGNADKAIAPLEWALAHAQEKPLQDLTRLRLARAQFSANKNDSALATLKQMPNGAYVAMTAELRGDVEAALGQTKLAVKAYEQAKSSYKEGAPQLRTLTMKIDNLARAGTPAEPETLPAKAAAASSQKQDA